MNWSAARLGELLHMNVKKLDLDQVHRADL